MNMLTTICANANALMERHFGLQDVEYADDTNLIHTHLPSLHVLALNVISVKRHAPVLK